MSANAWRARKGSVHPIDARDERLGELPCRAPGCLRNRRGGPNHLHMIVPMERIPHWAYGTNRRGRRNARKRPPRGLR